MDDFSHILLACDYDRTMTGFDGRIPPANLEAAARFMAKGGAFTIATGRSLPMFQAPVKTLQVNAPIILANGAALWSPEDGGVTLYCALDGAALEAVREIQSRFPALRLELQGLRMHCCFGHDDLRDAYLRRYGIPAVYGPWGEWTDTFLSASFYAPFRAVGHVKPADALPEEERPFEAIQALAETEFAALLDGCRSMPRMIELLPKGCGKGRAARRLAQALGRAVLLCAGDAPNDLPMLEEADEAFIPATADPAIQGRGFTETAGCDQGTIASIVALLEGR